MPGRTPSVAFQAFIEPLASAIACIAKCKLTPSSGGRADSSKDHQLLTNDGDAIRIGGPSDLWLQLRMRYRFVQKEDLDGGPWKIQTLAYSYTVTTGQEARILSYHWHPGGPSHESAPHLHLGDSQLIDGASLTSKQHVPTGRVSLEQVIRYLIVEHGIEPRHDDWDNTLTLTHGVFELYRTWSTTPPETGPNPTHDIPAPRG